MYVLVPLVGLLFGGVADARVVHTSRDKILLEGDESGDDEDGDEDEVFALKGMPEDDSSEDEQDEHAMDSDEDIDDVHYAAAAAAEKGKKKEKQKKGKKGKKDESEDEEESESEEEGWGTKKSAYYASNADEIESDDEEANELEEQEAKRLQAKARDAMADDDFGLGDVVEGLPEEDGYVAILSLWDVPVVNHNSVWWTSLRSP